MITSISGFACDGKTSLINKLSSYGIIFTEHVGKSLNFGQNVLNIGDDFLSLQMTVMNIEIDRIIFIQKNIKRLDPYIFLDRNLIDTIIFTLYHIKKRKIKFYPPNFIDNICTHLVDNVESFPIFDKIFLIKPCQDKDFINQTCIRDDRIKTIDIDDFINSGKFYYDKYLTTYDKLQNINYCKELIEIDHPSKIGFKKFEKIIFTDIFPRK